MIPTDRPLLQQIHGGPSPIARNILKSFCHPVEPVVTIGPGPLHASDSPMARLAGRRAGGIDRGLAGDPLHRADGDSETGVRR